MSSVVDSTSPIGKSDALIILGLTACARAFYYLLGVRFDSSTLNEYMQFIDKQLLMDRLLESLWYYHANPPLLNLYTGTVLKLFGSDSDVAFSVPFHVLGFLLALAVFALVLRLSRSRGLAYSLTGLLVLSPAFVLYENWLMYTFPAAALLSLSAFLLLRYLDSGSGRWGLAFFSCLALIALTRSFFHLFWVVLITLSLLVILRSNTKQVILVAAVPLMLVAGWYGKNYYMFGSFSASSWLGLGLSNITTLTVSKDELIPLVDDGTLSSFAITSRYKEKSKLFGHVQEAPWGVPVLDRVRKLTGAYNFNHISLIEVNKRYTQDSLRTIRIFPGSYLRGVLIANRLFLSPASMNAYFSKENRLAVVPVEMVYNPLVYGALSALKKTEQPHFGYSGKYAVEVNTGNLLVLGLPLVFLYGFLKLVRAYLGRGSLGRAEAITLAYILFNTLYIYMIGTLLELGENYRYRFLQEPLTLILFAILVSDAMRGWQARRLAASV